MKHTIILSLLLLLALNLFCQTDETQTRMRGNVSHFEISQSVRYRTVLPNDFDESKDYIIFICLHSERGNAISLLDAVAPFTIENDIILVAPSAPFYYEAILPGAIENNPSSWAISFVSIDLWISTTIQSANYIGNLAKHLREQFNTKAIYVFGMFQGGGTALEAGIRHTEAFDGIISFEGYLLSHYYEGGYHSISTEKTIPVLIKHTASNQPAVYAYERIKNAGWGITAITHDERRALDKNDIQAILDWIKNK